MPYLANSSLDCCIIEAVWVNFKLHLLTLFQRYSSEDHTHWDNFTIGHTNCVSAGDIYFLGHHSLWTLCQTDWMEFIKRSFTTVIFIVDLHFLHLVCQEKISKNKSVLFFVVFVVMVAPIHTATVIGIYYFLVGWCLIWYNLDHHWL